MDGSLRTPPPPSGSRQTRARLEAIRATLDAGAPAAEARSPVSASRAADERTDVRRQIQRWVVRIAGLAILLVIPFLAFVRTAVWFYQGGRAPWVALLGAAIVCASLLTIAGARLSHLMTGRHRFRFIATRIVAPLVLVYCGYTLFYLSGLNAKTEDVRSYYRRVHPVLRVALGTVLLADREIVVTDARRVPEDYARMGLPVYGRSLHFEQESGWVHAVDLRTIGRSAWKNLLLTGYFRSMGFRTLRHVGTADHLHVSLPPR